MQQNYYSTSFAPPKKVTKEKTLSNNIKKFLEKQREEEEEKARLAHEKKLDLVARRDPKVQRKIEKTLKVIKSSKKFYTGDKTLDENTALTLENEHPDEDDYGFASSTSDIYYKKLMEKYQQLPVEDKLSRIFKPKKGKAATTTPEGADNLHFKNGHRDRVSKLKGESNASTKSTKSQSSEKKPAVVEFKKPKPKLKAAPVVDFQELLKLAEKKQHEEILIAVPTKKKEPERLLTSKEKRELEELEAAKKAKLKPMTTPKIPKLGAIPKLSDSLKQDKNNNEGAAKNKALVDKSKLKATNPSGSKLRDALCMKQDKPTTSSQAPSKLSTISNLKSREMPSKLGSGVKTLPARPTSSKDITKTREFPPRDVQRTREFPPKDLQRSREFPPRDLKRPRDIAMRDMKRSKQQQQQVVKRKNFTAILCKFNKIFTLTGRIIDDDDDDSEYDSEMDDFIDDGDANVDVSSAIQSIFGYDKSR